MDCRYFDECSAPICPKDEGVKNMTWFPDEPVCRLNNSPEWVTRQRRIAHKVKGFEAGYFTLAMLQQDCRIAQGIKGINPDGTDKERVEAEKEWFIQHPAITEAEREAMRVSADRLKKAKSREDIVKTPPSFRAYAVLPAEKGIQVPLSPGQGSEGPL
jgi:hypothetical protein